MGREGGERGEDLGGEGVRDGQQGQVSNELIGGQEREGGDVRLSGEDEGEGEGGR